MHFCHEHKISRFIIHKAIYVYILVHTVFSSFSFTQYVYVFAGVHRLKFIVVVVFFVCGKKIEYFNEIKKNSIFKNHKQKIKRKATFNMNN